MAQNVNFAPIRNPANAQKAFVYRVNRENCTLEYDHRVLTKSKANDANPRWNKDPDLVNSTPLLGTGNLVTLKFDDVVHVYGIVQKSKTVALVSPFVEPVTPNFRATTGVLAGSVYDNDGDEEAWLAYQAQGKSGQPIIKYSNVTAPDADDKESRASDIRDGTGLSLFYDSQRWWLVYQNTSGNIVCYNEKVKTPANVSFNGGDFLSGTPIATIFIPKSEINLNKVPGFNTNTLGRLIVYWVRQVNGQNTLYRSHSDLNPKSHGADFSPPEFATAQGVAVEPLAQIGIIKDISPDPKENPSGGSNSNYLYITKAGKKDVSVVIDSWAATNE